ncbi:MAG: hypothetical protein U9P72_06315 [Campylobacterota bacterium]|nr:hypothetical protein [Campylobacterota bacterium]
MKNKLFTLVSIVFLSSIFVACSSDKGSKTVSTPAVLEDIILVADTSIICTNETVFTVVPTDNPEVLSSTDTSSGDTTIYIQKDSLGTVLIQNCTKK